MSRPTHHLPSAIPVNRLPVDDGVTKYRVRDREDDSIIWGDGLAPGDAFKLRDHITATKQNKGRAMIIEPMPVVEDAQIEDLSAPAMSPLPDTGFGIRLEDGAQGRVTPAGTDYKVASATKTTITADGTITEIPPGHQLLIDGQERPVPTRVQRGNVLECRSLAPPVAAARAAAADAVSQVIAAKRRIPLDVTVRQPPPRTAPPPPDKTVSNRPVTVRLGTPPSAPPKPPAAPQAVAELVDGDALPDDALTDADLPDIAADLGGGASDADVAHARKQAEAEKTGA